MTLPEQRWRSVHAAEHLLQGLLNQRLVPEVVRFRIENVLHHYPSLLDLTQAAVHDAKASGEAENIIRLQMLCQHCNEHGPHTGFQDLIPDKLKFGIHWPVKRVPWEISRSVYIPFYYGSICVGRYRPVSWFAWMPFSFIASSIIAAWRFMRKGFNA